LYYAKQEFYKKLQMSKIKKILGMGLVILSFAGVPLATYGASTTANTTINASIASVISMTTSGTVSISVTPTSSGAMSSASDTVSVSTNNTAGYALTLSDSNTNTDLVKGSDTITADAGTQASPSNTLTNNRWGYRVDSVGGFGAGPTSAETNVSSSAYKWAGVPSSAAPNTLKSTATTASGDTTTVWYGVKSDSTKPNGIYTDTVTYTATTN
jgi:hypothetical protein